MAKEKQSLLIVYDYFYPGYKAGGPVQSLSNLIIALPANFDISVLTSVYDLHSDKPYTGVKTNSWNSIELPGSASPLNVWYADKNNLSSKQIKALLIEVSPDIIYLNGIFSFRFFMLPLRSANRVSQSLKIIICPRGMLQQGALANRQLKKKVYLRALKMSSLLKKVTWHATNEEEKNDIKKIFGKKQLVDVASNIPKKPLAAIQPSQKKAGELRLVYLSLIAEKKNLLFLLSILKNCDGISLDIYGPVKDNDYWIKCKKLINQMPAKVKYKGDVVPAKVQKTFAGYDASVLLTKGENFGHALYESMSSGRPVITSNSTPWINLQQQKAGWNIDITTINEGVTLLNHLKTLPANIFNGYCTGAHELATKYYSQLNTIKEYTRLF